MGDYHVILADPPWQYRTHTDPKKPRQSTCASHYSMMPLDAIKALPVRGMAAKNAALFLWVTMPCLPEGIEVMRAWGFEYRTTAFTWVKQYSRSRRLCVGLGHYTRGNAEVCLLGIRGRMERRAKDVQQIILSPRREHSRKPDEQYERIMRLFDGPYLEMFARQRWPGWDVWGNETDRFEAEASSYAEAVAG